MAKQKVIHDVIVVGGGAAGMMAAGVAAERGKRVLLLEKNARLGEKLSISGGKRCNILNAERDQKKLLANYGDAEQFLYSAFSKFDMQDTFNFFEERGLPLMVEARNRAFPKSGHAKDVVDTLRAYLTEGKVQIKLNSPVTKIKHKGGTIESIEAGGEQYYATSYIFATGGLSRPSTGSTGDGFRWLTELGHTVATPTPAIVPLTVREKWIADAAGISIPSVKIAFAVDGVRAFSKSGPLLFTHTGISGPVVLNSSAKVADLFQEGEVTAHIDMFPDRDLGSLDEQLTDLFARNKNKDVKNVLKDFLAPGVPGLLLSRIPEMPAEAKVNGVTKEIRRKLIELSKDFTLTISGLAGFEKAVIADGGIPLTELDMRTMRSSKIDNLFVIGDLLHINRPSGGFSLQLCWTLGYLAGMNA